MSILLKFASVMFRITRLSVVQFLVALPTTLALRVTTIELLCRDIDLPVRKRVSAV